MQPIDYRNSTFADLQNRLHGMRLLVWQAWQQYGPCTTRELARRSGMDILSVRPRTTELHQLGLVTVEGDGNEGIYAAASADVIRQRFVTARQAEMVQRHLAL